MARVISITTIHKTVTPGKAKTATEKAVKPVVEVIPAGTILHAEGRWLDELRRAGAVRDPGKDEKVPVDFEKVPVHVEHDEDTEARLAASKNKKPAGGNKSAASSGGKAAGGKSGKASDTDADDDNDLV